MAVWYEVVYIYQMVPFSITLNDPHPDFKGTPLFDVEYLGKNTR